MSIKRYIANKDTVLYNAYRPDMITRATGSNVGLADSLECFYIYGQQASASQEQAKILLDFPVSTMSTDRTAGTIPASGSCSFFLRLYNVAHAFTTPKDFILAVQPVSRSWNEGYGLDLDAYTDNGVANWTQAASASSGYTSWTTEGGDFHTASYTPGTTLPAYTVTMKEGTEDINLNITSLVEEWMAAGGVAQRANYGLGVYMSSSITDAASSSYTKRFSARGTEYFFSRPVIEVRWDNSTKDDRTNFYASSSLATADDNQNGLLLYNTVRGQLKDIPDKGAGESIYVKLYTDLTSSIDYFPESTVHFPTAWTASWAATGIYSASVALNTSASYLYDRWYTDEDKTLCIHSGSRITVKDSNASSYNPNNDYVISITNLKTEYSQDDVARFQMFVRTKGWNPNVYDVVQATPQHEIVEDLYYQVNRVTDGITAVEYGTGSTNHTRCSYDASGSYFTMDMSLFESDYMYQISFARKKTSTEYVELNDRFKFRVK